MDRLTDTHTGRPTDRHSEGLRRRRRGIHGRKERRREAFCLFSFSLSFLLSSFLAWVTSSFFAALSFFSFLSPSLTHKHTLPPSRSVISTHFAKANAVEEKERERERERVKEPRRTDGWSLFFLLSSASQLLQKFPRERERDREKENKKKEKSHSPVVLLAHGYTATLYLLEDLSNTMSKTH